MAPSTPTLTVWKTEDEIRQRIRELATQLNRDYADRELHVLGILRGGFVFMADLIRAMGLDVKCHFINLYFKNASLKDEEVREIEETVIYPPKDLTGKHLLLLDSVLDTGIVMNHIVNHLHVQGAASIRVAVLVDKPFSRRVDLNADYVAFELPDREFIFGYGMDRDDHHRNLPYLAKMS